MYLGDNLVGAPIRDAVEGFQKHPELAASVMLKGVENPCQFGVAELNEAGEIARLVEKPKQPLSNLALVGIYMFRPSVFGAI
jgi:glucose-1-phosphate thymidylyltransferase